MQVKKIISDSVTKALTEAKEQYGDEIILLESREIQGETGLPGKRRVQVTISVNESGKPVRKWVPPAGPAGSPKEPAGPAEKEKKPENDFSRMVTDILAKKPFEFDQEKKILNELTNLRQEILQITRQSVNPALADFPEEYSQVYTGLLEKGLTPDVAHLFIRRVYQILQSVKNVRPAEIEKGVRNEMARIFEPYRITDSPANSPKIILLLGATGVGKSTTAMKLAAHPALYGKKDVVIISTDPYGPSEALKSFSKMNGTTIYEARKNDDIEKVLEKFKDREVIIVDTPGQSPFAPNHLKRLEEYIQLLKPTDIFLVLSLNTDLKDLFLTSALYLLLKPSGVIFTKFDETSQPGKVFAILDELKLPVVACSEGKRIFIDIEPGQIDFLYKKIFEN